MKSYLQVAIATAFVACLQAAPARAQTTPAADTAATPAPAASPAPAATPAPPAPAAPPASADKAGSTDKTTASERPKKHIRMSTRQQIAHALKTGTVPARYRSQVPKQYQRYIPFER